MKKLLLHTCCAPCASGCIERLFAENREVTLYFSNSNIDTEEEYEKRLNEVRKFAEHFHLPLLTDPYDHAAWLAQVSQVPDHEKQPERGLRCSACFAWSLRRTAEEAERLGQVDFLVEGTIYSDLIEGSKEPVNTHTDAEGRIGNVHHLEVLEPLRELFKSDVREAGLLLGIPEDMVYRQPFPGPGLAIRCKGEVTAEKLAILREADAIFREEVEIAGLSRKIGQYFAMLIDMDTTGIRDGKRVTGSTIALRAVNSTEAMKATAARLPYDLLEKCVTRITEEVPGVVRVMYDITGKPPATIEWE